MDPRIADYITANRKKYTRQAIRQQLIDAGHDPAEVDRTWAALETPDPDAVIGERFWGRFALIVIGVNVVVFLLVGLLSGMLGYVFAGAGGAILPIILGVALAIGALIAWGVVALTGPAKMGPTTALVVGISIPLVIALLIGGACYAMVGAIGPPPPPPRDGTMQLELDSPQEFAGSGSAMCQIYPDGGSLNVFGENLGSLDGRQVSASVFSSGPAPGIGGEGGATPAPAEAPGVDDPAARSTSVNVSLLPRTDTEFPLEWFPGPGSGLSADIAPDGLSGTITFDGFVPSDGPEVPPSGEDTETLDGRISWTCE